MQSAKKEVGQIGCGRDLSSLQTDYKSPVSASPSRHVIVSAVLSQEMTPDLLG